MRCLWALALLPGPLLLACQGLTASPPERALAVAVRPDGPATAALGQTVRLRVRAVAAPGLCLQALRVEALVDPTDRSFTLKPIGQPVAAPWNQPCASVQEASVELTLPSAGTWTGLVWDGQAFTFDEARTPVVRVEAVGPSLVEAHRQAL